MGSGERTRLVLAGRDLEFHLFEVAGSGCQSKHSILTGRFAPRFLGSHNSASQRASNISGPPCWQRAPGAVAQARVFKELRCANNKAKEKEILRVEDFLPLYGGTSFIEDFYLVYHT